MQYSHAIPNSCVLYFTEIQGRLAPVRYSKFRIQDSIVAQPILFSTDDANKNKNHCACNYTTYSLNIYRTQYDLPKILRKQTTAVENT